MSKLRSPQRLATTKQRPASAPPLVVTIPHSGELVPDEVYWLKGLPETTLMRDVDRYVDELYGAVLEELKIYSVISRCHRYVVDLNRFGEDIDCESVEGSPLPSGEFPMGLHWSVTTHGEKLIKAPISEDLHRLLIQRYYDPFHQEVMDYYRHFEDSRAGKIFHIDAHSMPGLGTTLHRDPGQLRAQVVVSDCEGKSCSSVFKDLVIESYKDAGFEVAYNWPYLGGRITQKYGRPEMGHHCIQVELNRAQYMDEKNHSRLEGSFEKTQSQISKAIKNVYSGLRKMGS